MLKIRLFLLFTICCNAAIFAQTELSFGPKNAAFGNAASVEKNPYAVFSNPATSPLNVNSIGVWVENRFTVQDFSVYAIHGTLNNLQFGFRASGNKYLAEYNPNLAYSLPLTNRFQLGLGLSGFFNRIQSQGAENNQNFTAQIGTVFQLSHQITLAGLVRNFIQTTTEKQFQKQELLSLSVHYKPDSILNFFSEIQSFGNATSFIFGLGYQISEQLMVSYAIRSNPFSHHIGLQFQAKSIAIFLSGYYHNFLGFSPSMGFLYIQPQPVNYEEME